MFTDSMITRMRTLLQENNKEHLECVTNVTTSEEWDLQNRVDIRQEGLDAVKFRRRGVYAPIRTEVQTRIKNKNTP